MRSIDVVLSNYSFNSISNKSDLFCKMFPDSKIAENFSCGKTECSYVVCFGLAPYFKGLLTKSLSNVEHIVAFFDESFNKTSKRGQMDMHVRYWDNNHNYLATRYYHYGFVDKLLQSMFLNPLVYADQISAKNKLLQVSSDGPNVNLSFLDLFEEDRKRKNWANLSQFFSFRSFWQVFAAIQWKKVHSDLCLQGAWNVCLQTLWWNPQDLASWCLRKFPKSLSLINSCQVGKPVQQNLSSLNFFSTTVKENKGSFVKLEKETDRDTFIW